MSDDTKSEKVDDAKDKAAAKGKAAPGPGDFVKVDARGDETGRVVDVIREKGQPDKAHVTWPKSRVESVHPVADLTPVERPKPKKE